MAGASCRLPSKPKMTPVERRRAFIEMAAKLGAEGDFEGTQIEVGRNDRLGGGGSDAMRVCVTSSETRNRVLG